MAGINFNELPKDLQAKLQPYMTIGGAKSVEEAIAKAKDAKAWTEADDKALNSLNGGANWGKTMDEVAFDSSKAKEYKADLPRAQKENQLAEARRRNERTKFIADSQAELDKKKEDLRRSIVEKRSQGVTGYLSAMADRIKLDMMPSRVGEQQAGFGGVAGKFLVAAAVAAVTVAFTSCSKDFNYNENDNINLKINVENDNKALLEAILNELKNMNSSLQSKINILIDKL